MIGVPITQTVLHEQKDKEKCCAAIQEPKQMLSTLLLANNLPRIVVLTCFTLLRTESHATSIRMSYNYNKLTVLWPYPDDKFPNAATKLITLLTDQS